MHRSRFLMLLIGLAFAVACSLDIEDLPENNPPLVDAIRLDPPTVAPLDSIELGVHAEDPDGDLLYFLWDDGGVSESDWLDDIKSDSVVTWIAPPSLSEIDSIVFSVRVYDFDLAESVRRDTTLYLESHTGTVTVTVLDLEGNPAAVPLVVAGVTLSDPASEATFTEVPWGWQSLHSLQTETHFGATGNFAGYPEDVYVEAGQTTACTLVVAPRSLLLLPSEPEDLTTISEIQAAVDWCLAMDLDTLLVRAGTYPLVPQAAGAGWAGVVLEEQDLYLAAFPGEEVTLTGSEEIDYCLYLEGRGKSCLISDLTISGGATSAYLYHSSGSFEGVVMEACSSTGIFLDGGESDTLQVTHCEFDGIGFAALSLSGGELIAENSLIADCDWYGLWLRDGAGAELGGLTLVDNAGAGLFTSGAGTVLVQRCLMSGNGAGLFNSSGTAPLSGCNLFWGQTGADYIGVEPGADDLSADPLFCDPEGDNWHLQADSPAIGGVCGQIGAFGIGDCDVRRQEKD